MIERLERLLEPRRTPKPRALTANPTSPGRLSIVFSIVQEANAQEFVVTLRILSTPAASNFRMISAKSAFSGRWFGRLACLANPPKRRPGELLVRATMKLFEKATDFAISGVIAGSCICPST